MKKIIAIVAFLFGVLLTTYLIKVNNPIKDFYSKYKNINLNDSLTFQNKGILKFFSNDFEVNLVPGIYKKNTDRTGGILFDQNNNFLLVEQNDITKIFFTSHQFLPRIDSLFPGIEPALDSNNGFYGGVRKFFKFKNNLFGLVTLKVKKEDCYFASIVNFTTRKEVFRAPCVPDFLPPNVDYNAIGGGNIEYKDSLLFSLGAPSVFGKRTESLAQNMNSPYGKVLVFSKRQLIDGLVSKYNYKIYTSGHRNIQGLVNLKNEIFAVEHGPMGGDEINHLKFNSNYGWPIISLGLDYNFKNIYLPDSNSKKYTLPLFSFIPSVATSDIIEAPTIIKNRYKSFDVLLIGSLKGQSIFIVLLEKISHKVISIERININMRLRQFTKDNDGKIYISTDNFGIYEIIFRKLYE
jgi:hypothetical protein